MKSALTPKEIFEKAAELIATAAEGNDGTTRLARVLASVFSDASSRLRDFVEGCEPPEMPIQVVEVVGARPLVKATVQPIKRPGRPKGSKNKPKIAKVEMLLTMSGEQDLGAICEFCSCDWDNPCPQGCEWSQDYKANGRFVCSNPGCRKKGYDADVAFLKATESPAGYCGPISAEQLEAQRKATETKG